MTDIKKKLQAEIEKKAEKRKQLREQKKVSKPIEDFVIEFFKEAESLHTTDQDGNVSRTLITLAVIQLGDQIRLKYDDRAKVWATYNPITGMVSDINIAWSPSYRIANKVEENLRIGAEVLLFK